ncbi:uncharacterized protein LOC105261651 [Musca domestica]|uniref:protein disulfide-isomerase n=1 Tax=Musca domestica TaxID=7370 RepID=A0A1I8NJZ4_MUSDO|nr:uncharacterized protein LOC105261651 [Musca domestica]
MTEEEEEFRLFRQITIEDDESNQQIIKPKTIIRKRKYPPRPPRLPPSPQQNLHDNYVDFVCYVREKCENKIKILQRSTFQAIERPIILAFNHFREFCYYHQDKLDTLFKLSLQYGDRIEFLVGDQMDMDVLYPNTNPIELLSYSLRPEDQNIQVYAINERKWVYEHFDAYNTEETLAELCENLLNGSIYRSQAIPEPGETLVKICVHLSFEKVVWQSSQDILLIIGYGDYSPRDEYHLKYEPNYEELAKEFVDSNVKIVYMDGDKNYTKFEYNAGGYPTILFIPHNDKNAFIHYMQGARDTENMRNFIKQNVGAQGEKWRQEDRNKLKYKPFSLATDKQLTYEDLGLYVDENFPRSFQLLNRNSLKTDNNCHIIHLFDFQGTPITYYQDILKKIHQVAQGTFCYAVKFLIGDFRDVNIIFPKWYLKHLDNKQLENSKQPQVYAIDRMKLIYKISDLPTPSSWFYYFVKLHYSQLSYSQTPYTCRPWRRDVVKTCVAENFHTHINNSRHNIFLTIYRSNYIESHKILNILNEIAQEVQDFGVELLKMDVKYNSISVEYSFDTYPVHFFIPKRNRDEETVRYINKNSSKENILEFIRNNSGKYS